MSKKLQITELIANDFRTVRELSDLTGLSVQQVQTCIGNQLAGLTDKVRRPNGRIAHRMKETGDVYPPSPAREA